MEGIMFYDSDAFTALGKSSIAAAWQRLRL